VVQKAALRAMPVLRKPRRLETRCGKFTGRTPVRRAKTGHGDGHCTIGFGNK
jgi:hypothetical protein